MDRPFGSGEPKGDALTLSKPLWHAREGKMSREVPTTRYFAVGFFTAEQLEARDRAMLARAGQNAPVSEIRSAVEVVSITVFDVDTGSEMVEIGMRKVSLVVQDPQVQA